MKNHGFTVEDIIQFYITLRRYKNHDKSLELCKKNFYPKVFPEMTEELFSIKVERLINKALKKRG